MAGISPLLLDRKKSRRNSESVCAGFGPSLDLYALVSDLKRRGLQTPVLFRFPDVTAHRQAKLQVMPHPRPPPKPELPFLLFLLTQFKILSFPVIRKVVSALLVLILQVSCCMSRFSAHQGLQCMCSLRSIATHVSHPCCQMPTFHIEDGTFYQQGTLETAFHECCRFLSLGAHCGPILQSFDSFNLLNR
jgi:hypothetical protein